MNTRLNPWRMMEILALLAGTMFIGACSPAYTIQGGLATFFAVAATGFIGAVLRPLFNPGILLP
jgi:hypothetical protein